MPAEEPRAQQVARIASFVALAYFAARLVGYAWTIAPEIPPDEATHLGRILAYSQTWGLPAPSPDNHALGLLGHRPFLYSWTLGRLAALGLDGLLALRLVDAALAMGTALFGLGFIRTVSDDARTHLVFVLLLTNTLMFTGIGAAVSYDNGVNLLAAASFYCAARLLQSFGPERLAALLLVLGLGCLTKRSFLPLAAGIVVLLAYHERERLRRGGAWLRPLARPLWVAVAVVAIANAVLYGGNLLRFGRLVPGFEQVVGVEAARTNRIFARDYILDGYREGRLSFQEALRATGEIAHPGDRRSTRMQLAGIRKRIESGDDRRMGLPRYVYWWSRIMLDRATGYFGHRVLRRTSWELAAFASLLALATAFRLLARRGRPAPIVGFGAGVALAYALVLLFFVNRPVYLEKGILDAGVQGRYLFPVWVPVMGWMAVGLWQDPPRRVRGILAVAACGLFLWSDLPSLLLRAGPGWFDAP